MYDVTDRTDLLRCPWCDNIGGCLNDYCMPTM